MSSATLVRDAHQKRLRMQVTPEGIALPITVASRGARVGALMIDLTIFLFAYIAIEIVFGLVGAGLSSKQADPANVQGAAEFLFIVKSIILFLLGNGYFLFFELGPRGATPGKRLVGIRIAARDGGWLTAEMVIARNLIRDIELFLPFVMILMASFVGDGWAAGWLAAAWFLIFALFPFFNRDALRAGDLIAGTWVVEAPRQKLEAAISLGHAVQAGASRTTGMTYRFGDKELSAYGEFELKTLERVLREGRKEALVAVHEAICRKIGWDPGAGDEHAFLEAYYTQLRARLEGQMRFGQRKADKWAGGS